MNAYIQIFFGSILLSLVHATIPSHWLPLIAISKAEKWNEKETLLVTAITGIAHTSSTVIIGIIVGIIGYKLSESYHYITHYVAPTILVAIGLLYLVFEYRHKLIKNKQHHHHHVDIEGIIKKKKSKRSIIISLSVAMFISPCMEIEVYYLTASRLGWIGIGIVSIVYFFVTVLGIMFLVFFAAKGIEKLKWHFMEHHEKLISGLILILVGALALFIEF
jgi:nickel/cobalt transporter (NicO) family protein